MHSLTRTHPNLCTHAISWIIARERRHQSVPREPNLHITHLTYLITKRWASNITVSPFGTKQTLRESPSNWASSAIRKGLSAFALCNRIRLSNFSYDDGTALGGTIPTSAAFSASIPAPVFELTAKPCLILSLDSALICEIVFASTFCESVCQSTQGVN